jgi:hypothetical protein
MSWLRYRVESDYVVGIFDNGTTMLFDAGDLELVSAHNWHVDNMGYPCAWNEGQKTRLHRLLVRNVPDGLVVDHVNRNKLDNRRKNLRVVTQRTNSLNSSIRSNNTSGVSGVFFDKRAKRWRAQIYKDGKTTHVGIFDCFDDAVVARKEAERKFYGGGSYL